MPSVAIIGSGPSGFFAAEALLKSEQPRVTHVDLYDRLCTPYGLVRLGVAPDHPKIKMVAKAYEKMFVDQRLRFFGNVTIGRDLSVEELRSMYDAVIITSGAENDRRLGVPGEDLVGSHTATAFVAWYNGHPDARDHDFDLSAEVAFVVGQGNVAMDVARVLAKSADELKKTDIAQHALEQLAESRIKEIHVIGRRGPAQVKFTPPEIRELGELVAAEPFVEAAALTLNEASQQEHDAEIDVKKIYEILRGYTELKKPGARKVLLRFLLSPKELQGDGKLARVVLEKNVLTGVAGSQSAKGTGETTTEPCGLLFRSVGYKGRAIAGLPFDEKSGTIPNDKGRVVTGVYTAGWIKRGPSGVIGTNKPCAQETAAHVLTDLPGLPAKKDVDASAVVGLLKERGVRVVTWEDWKKIDAAEVERGAKAGKPREKLVRTEEMLALLR